MVAATLPKQERLDQGGERKALARSQQMSIHTSQENETMAAGALDQSSMRCGCRRRLVLLTRALIKRAADVPMVFSG